MRIEIPTWILCGSHGKFEFTPSAVFKSKPYSNPDSIFLWIPVFTVAGPTKFISPVFSLSPPLLLCLSLSPLGHYIAKPQKADSIPDQNHKCKINPPRPLKHKQPWLPKPKLRNPNPLPRPCQERREGERWQVEDVEPRSTLFGEPHLLKPSSTWFYSR